MEAYLSHKLHQTKKAVQVQETSSSPVVESCDGRPHCHVNALLRLLNRMLLLAVVARLVVVVMREGVSPTTVTDGATDGGIGFARTKLRAATPSPFVLVLMCYELLGGEVGVTFTSATPRHGIAMLFPCSVLEQSLATRRQKPTTIT